MKILLAVIILLFLSACGTTSMTYNTDGSVEWSSNTLFKDVKDAKIIWTGPWGELNANLGSSAGNGGEQAMAKAMSCYLYPANCKD